jgi:cytochrome c-type biogenesis protein CcmH
VAVPLAALAGGAALVGAGAAAAETRSAQERVERGLLCHCGCTGLTVHACTCGTAAAIRSEIAARLAAGDGPEQVIESYVARYGEKIRPAPVKAGFNLLAWIAPFAALLGAGVALVLLIRRWEARGARTGPDAPAAAGPPGERQAASPGAPTAGGDAATAEAPGAREREILARIEREMREMR